MDTELQQPFVKSGHLIKRYIKSLRGVHLEKGLIRDPVEYERRVQRVFETNRSRCTGEKNKSLVLVFGIGGKGDGLWVPKAPLLARTGGKGLLKFKDMCF